MLYSTGAVRVKVGSASVKGETGNEAFSSNAAAGYLFKLTGESVWYEIGSIQNATNLTLSSRYSSSAHRTLRSSEHIATMTTATKIYGGILNYYPIIQENITITASGETFTDDGGGVLTGNASPPGSGIINYDTGAWAITLGTDLTATAEMTASYYSGDTRNGMGYLISVDYTPIYDIPEMSLNDINFPHIFTKAVRIIDSKLSYVASYGGDVFAAGNLTDNAIVRGDGGGKGVQTSTVLVSDDGEMTNPSQPAVIALITDNQTNVTGDATIYNITGAIFAEVKDQGNNFSDGTFTAPVTGTYQFSGVIGLENITSGHTYGYARIITSNRAYTVFSANPYALQGSGSLAVTSALNIDLDINDTVYLQVRIYGSTKTVSVTYATSFTIGLLC